MKVKVHGVLRRVLKFVLFAALAIPLFGFLVMWLWNWLMPAVFGLRAIGFWQAFGLLILSKILLTGFHGRPGSARDWRMRFIRRWDQMTPEEREKFRAGLRGGCEPTAPWPPAPGA
jgi:hypothetical protein